MAKKPEDESLTLASHGPIIITQERILELGRDEDYRPVFCKLRHPKTDSGAMFMFTKNNENVFEIMTFDEGCRSWFIENMVLRDGSFCITTPINPAFLILPYLIKSNKITHFMQLECILDDHEFVETKRLCNCLALDMSLVSDVKGSDDLSVYRFNKDKTLSWLRLKVDQLVVSLRKNEIDVTNTGAMLATYVRSSKYSEVSQDDYTRYACGLISEYLPVDLVKELENYLGIVQSNADVAPPSKKAKLDSLTPTEDYSQQNIQASKKPEKLTSAQKKLGKVDKQGIQAISSFFSAKPSKK